MLRKISKESMGTSDLGWLQSRFHFSFARYYNPKNINFGVLRVLNDDIIAPKSGFDMHPHENMEIITYIIEGELTHEDNLGNKETLKRGEVQYMSAGKGVVHAEHNLGEKPLRVLQIWVIPPKNGLPTLYGSLRLKEEQRQDKLLHVVSSKECNAPIQIYQDVDIFVTETQEEFSFTIEEQKQVYFVQIEGSSRVNELENLNASDALEITDENALHVKPKTRSHFLFIVMNKQ
jgi:hypothetical protein